MSDWLHIITPMAIRGGLLVLVLFGVWKLTKVPGLLARRAAASQDLIILCRQMSLFTKAGQGMPAGLRAAAGEFESVKLRKTVLDVADRIEAGMTLSGALEEHPAIFDGPFIAAVKTGERGGDLQRAFTILREWLVQITRARLAVQGALFYPVMTAVFGFVVVVFLLFNVVPSFKEVFGSFGTRLPLPTRIVLWVSDLATTMFFAWFPALVAAIIGLVMLGRRRPELIERTAMRLPIINRFLEASHIARFSATLRLLLGASVPLGEALHLAGRTAGPKYAPAVTGIAGRVERGESFARAIRDDGILPPLFMWYVESGEAGGDLESGLGEAAEVYILRARGFVEVLPAVLGPILICLVGAVIGIIILAMFMPLFAMSSMTG